MIEIREYSDHFYILEEERVREFLMVGEKEALLIDTGFADSHVAKAVRQVTSLPVRLLLTHGDKDHIGGLEDFGECYLHEGDWHLIPQGIVLHPLREKQVFRCAGYRLEVVEIPGHTYGSVAFVDWEKRLMLPGDSVQKKGPIYMFGKHRNLDLYIESQKKLCGLMDRIDTILPCHHEYPVTPDWIEKNLADAQDLRDGKFTGTPHPVMNCYSYPGTWTEFYYEAPEIGDGADS